jgi:hypothetical protein
MTSPNIELERQWARQLDEFGVENVRIALTSNVYILHVDREFAWKWLREQDERDLRGNKRIAIWTLWRPL